MNASREPENSGKTQVECSARSARSCRSLVCEWLSSALISTAGLRRCLRGKADKPSVAADGDTYPRTANKRIEADQADTLLVDDHPGCRVKSTRNQHDLQLWTRVPPYAVGQLSLRSSADTNRTQSGDVVVLDADNPAVEVPTAAIVHQLSEGPDVFGGAIEFRAAGQALFELLGPVVVEAVGVVGDPAGHVPHRRLPARRRLMRSGRSCRTQGLQGSRMLGRPVHWPISSSSAPAPPWVPASSACRQRPCSERQDHWTSAPSALMGVRARAAVPGDRRHDVVICTDAAPRCPGPSA